MAAVSPLDGQLCSLVLPWVDTETMSLFLAHTAAASQVPPTVHLLLPPYSPELNPVEHLWDHLRENYIGNQGLRSLARSSIISAPASISYINTAKSSAP